jgi:phosphoglycolate phosphatase-like HAD superfamily hydrolase
MAMTDAERQYQEQSADYAVLYDLDGVMVNSGARNFEYYMDVFELARSELNLPGLQPPPWEAIARCYPLGLEDAIAELTPPEYKDHRHEIHNVALRTPRHTDLLTFPDHMHEHVSEMRADNCGLAIVTNAPKDSVDEVFKARDGLEANFDVVIADAQKPNPDGLQLALDILGVGQGRAVFIGDTVHTDGDAARSAGINFIHFTSSEFDPDANARVRPNIGGSQFSLKGLTQAVRDLRATVSA